MYLLKILAPNNHIITLDIPETTLFGATIPNNDDNTSIIHGELVFQTGMNGYHQTFTDPSFTGQFIVCTHPLLGNYGIPAMNNDKNKGELIFDDKFTNPGVRVIICQEVYKHNLDIENSQRYHVEQLHIWMKRRNIIGITNVDCRALTQLIREYGSCPVMLASKSILTSHPVPTPIDVNSQNLVQIANYQLKHYLDTQSTTKYTIVVDAPDIDINEPYSRILVFDCGMKNSQLKLLQSLHISAIDIVPADYQLTPRDELLYSAIFISNGPGNPAICCTSLIQQLSAIMHNELWPDWQGIIFGICLGHQIMALAAGMEVTKMAYGHRGQNIPVKQLDIDDIKTVDCEWYSNSILAATAGRCFITSQNHGFCVQPWNTGESVSPGWHVLFKNVNDNSISGLIHENGRFISCQFHPEAAPGPLDTQWLFHTFKHMTSTAMYNMTSKDSGDISNPIYNPQLQTPDTTPHYYNNITIPKQPENSKQEFLGSVLVLGSGGLMIGQAGEFDYSGSQAIKAYREAKLRVVLLNPNIATMQTSMADVVYYDPITPVFVRKIIVAENINYLACSFGGQTALNCALEVNADNWLAKHNVCVLGTPLTTITLTEDRKEFAHFINNELRVVNNYNNIYYLYHTSNCNTESGISVPPGLTYEFSQQHCDANNVQDCIDTIRCELGDGPVLIRTGFSLGGKGSGVAYNNVELAEMLKPMAQNGTTVIVDKYLAGWKELEYEILRDQDGNKICVCAMENMDPLGIHTGESIVVAPTQTITDPEFQSMRTTAFAIVDQLNLIGECNVQFALCPHGTGQFYVIEMNARLSRSSALASKATGYPIAYVAARLGLGDRLWEIPNSVTNGATTAFFEPTLDYVTVKIPRWDLRKFPEVSPYLGSYMKSVGEVMAIAPTFTEALMKAMRMSGQYPFNGNIKDIMNHVDKLRQEEDYWDQYYDAMRDRVKDRHYLRLTTLIQLLYLDISNALSPNDAIHDLSLLSGGIQPWFLYQLYNIIITVRNPTNICKKPEYNIGPVLRRIDTVAAEFPAVTNYMYINHDKGIGARHDVLSLNNITLNTPASTDKNKFVIVLGSGVYRIGSSVEFDWCAVSCSRRLREMGYLPVIINNNPETVSTDYDEAAVLIFDEITVDNVVTVYKYLNTYGDVLGVIVSMGGQAANNIADELGKHPVITVLGTDPVMIDTAENRYKFSRLLEKQHIDQPRWTEIRDLTNLDIVASKISGIGGYPVLVRPSYVLSGAGMKVVNNQSELLHYLGEAKNVSPRHPVVVSEFITGAKEIEVDAVAVNGKVCIMAISEHVENAGVHSGDATLVLPAQDLTPVTIERVKQIAHKIANELMICGPMNIQLIAKDDRLRVIECNVRASRSFPFVSKTLNVNLVDIAVEIMITGEVPKWLKDTHYFDRVGVKCPVFSFDRLAGADLTLGVDMNSTGEVAGFGANRYVAFLKAWQAAHPKVTIPAYGSQTHMTICYMDDIKPDVSKLANLATDIGWIVTFVNITNYQTEYNDVIYNDIRDSWLLMNFCINTPGAQDINIQAMNDNIPVLTNYKVGKMLMDAIYYEYLAGQMLDKHELDIRRPLNNNIVSNNTINGNNCVNSIIKNGSQCVVVSEQAIISRVEPTHIVAPGRVLMDTSQFNRNLMRRLFQRADELYTANMYGDRSAFSNVLTGTVIGITNIDDLNYIPVNICINMHYIKRLQNIWKLALTKMGARIFSITKSGVSCPSNNLELHVLDGIVSLNNNNIVNKLTDFTISSISDKVSLDICETLAILYMIRQREGTFNNRSLYVDTHMVKIYEDLLTEYNTTIISNNIYMEDAQYITNKQYINVTECYLHSQYRINLERSRLYIAMAIAEMMFNS